MADDAGSGAAGDDLAQDWRAGGFGLYIHWPFCTAKCPYCDFNSHVAQSIDQPRWRAAYLREIARVAALTPGRVLNSVFFGGGTPSLMAPETVAEILQAVRASWPLANDHEVTLEANPGSVEAGRFGAYRDAGVNRISLGVQALDDVALRRLGRLHDVAEARAAFEVARGLFERVSFDLIYARQDQSAADWRRELREALAMAADHLSLYQLTIEDGTVFAARRAAGGLRGLPDEDRAADLFEITQELCEAAGLPAYEVSNHARPGAESRHNLIYWRSGDYAGIGPGAHGRLSLGDVRLATTTPLAPGRWLELQEGGGSGAGPQQVLSRGERLAELLLTGLRLREGVAAERIERFGGAPIESIEINDLFENDLILLVEGRLACTARGRMVLNAVLRRMLDGFGLA